MRKTFEIIGIVVLLITIGWFVSKEGVMQKGIDYDSMVKKLQEERDSIQTLFNASRNREQLHILKSEQDSIRRVATEKKIAVLESKNKTYSQRLKEIEKITISRPDSFLIKRYPNADGN